MKLRMLSGLMLAGLLAAGYANAECVYPKAPTSMPDGKTATEEEMIAGMKGIKEYNAAVTAYLNCLDTEMQARITEAGPDAPSDQIVQIKSIHSKRHNAAVEELEAHATRFNEQVRAYKARAKG
jgi:hypothetical protein